MHKSGGAKDTLKAVSSEGQSSVVAGLALCAASAGPCVCALLRWWSHTADTNTSRNKQTLQTNIFYVGFIKSYFPKVEINKVRDWFNRGKAF